MRGVRRRAGSRGRRSAWADDAVLKALVTKGVDVVAVAHAGRTVTPPSVPHWKNVIRVVSLPVAR